MKNHEKASEKELTEMEANKLPYAELKTMVKRTLKELSENFKKLSENFNSMKKNIGTIKKELE